ncbi:hypothetical protein GCM10010387_27630 [Streptomyces inusitatus]|uniref:PepSY domain-containing protein n=1 Tax=Streptomyces inusitatus TaxID=68221 RepID=A0A918Q4P2_9ACTN|nr:PepSY domain-containing protein [Streptomyces inusitatus]GGZ31914.1 hypothetical protein GCM10010387_27630 [Streptomyces inusitatus]
MKRKILVAVAALALVGGGAFTAVAASGDDDKAVPASKISVTDAVNSALKKQPGVVESAGRDDDGDGAWEVEIVDAKGLGHEIRVDAKTADASVEKDDDDDRDDDRDDRDDDRREGDAAVGDATVSAEQAVSAALSFRPGAVTEVEFDDGHWAIEVRAEDGKEHDVRVDAKTAEATVEKDDDRNDKGAGRDDERNDGRDDLAADRADDDSDDRDSTDADDDADDRNDDGDRDDDRADG